MKGLNSAQRVADCMDGQVKENTEVFFPCSFHFTAKAAYGW